MINKIAALKLKDFGSGGSPNAHEPKLHAAFFPHLILLHVPLVE